jgi:mono/diheme cytochrome c family protein
MGRLLTTPILAALLLCAPTRTQAQEPAEHPGFLAIKGRATFMSFCASCHGPKADGKGNIAQYLTTKPTDLTQIAKQQEGKFPGELIGQVISGPEKVRGHGTREMPIWGNVFQSLLASDTARDETPEERANRKIRELTAYLESVQQQ